MQHVIPIDSKARPLVLTQIRHSVPAWLRDLRLGARLSLVVALVVAAVVASVAYLEVRAFETHINNDLVDAARLGAESVAQNIATRPVSLDPLDIRDALHDLLESDPVLDTISVFESDAANRARVLTSTSTEERSEAVELAARVIGTRTYATDRTATVVMFAMPLTQRPRYAVVVSVGLESLIQARGHALRVALGFAVPTILLVTGLVHVVVRQLVGRPLRAILQTMDRTARGDTRARTNIRRRDELGMIAARLNDMLDELARFNQSLNQRIDEATSALSARNVELAASRHQLLAAQESLAGAERVAALGQLAANVAHQAGTPLNLVSGYVQMVRDDPRTDEWIRSRLLTVDAQIQQVTRVLRAMLDHARPPSPSEDVLMAEVVERVREVSQPRLLRSGIELRVDVASGLPAVRAEVTQLEMALLNLVTNAVDAMPNGGTLTIAALAGVNGIRLEVSDTGTGIAPEVAARIFEPWVTTKPKGHGTGLGLAIVRQVIRAHGGVVSAHSLPRGTMVVIELPIAPIAAVEVPA